MRYYAQFTFVAVALGVVALLAGCAQAPAPAPAPAQTAQKTTVNSTTVPMMPDGETLFAANCASCHAKDKKLDRSYLAAMKKMSFEEAKNVVINGKKPMPSFKGKLTSQEITIVAYYVWGQTKR